MVAHWIMVALALLVASAGRFAADLATAARLAWGERLPLRVKQCAPSWISQAVGPACSPCMPLRALKAPADAGRVP